MNDFKENRRLQWKLKRIEKGIKLKELANIIGFSVSMMSRYENAQRDLSLENEKIYKEYITNK